MASSLLLGNGWLPAGFGTDVFRVVWGPRAVTGPGLWCWWHVAHMWQKVQVPGYEREPLFHIMHIAWNDSGYRFSCTLGLDPIGAPMAMVDMVGGGGCPHINAGLEVVGCGVLEVGEGTVISCVVRFLAEYTRHACFGR